MWHAGLTSVHKYRLMDLGDTGDEHARDLLGVKFDATTVLIGGTLSFNFLSPVWTVDQSRTPPIDGSTPTQVLYFPRTTPIVSK